MEKYNKLKLRSGVFVFLASLLAFIMLYLRISFVFESEITRYGSYFLEYLLNTLIAVTLGATLFAGHGLESFGRRLLSSLKLSLPRLVYLVPYYYLYYMSEGYDSFESLSLLLIRCAFLLLFFVLEMNVFFWAARFAAKKAEASWDFYKPSALFDFSCGASVGIFAISFTKFIVNVLTEGYDIVTYLIDYGEFYTAEEIYFMLGKLTLAFLALFLSHIAVMVLRGRFIKRLENTEAEE